MHVCFTHGFHVVYAVVTIITIGIIRQGWSIVIGRIHRAIVAATVGAIVAETIVATIAPTGCGDDRLV